jgi:transposase
MVTTEEIEELIVKLHNEGKNMREISKHEGVRKNFTYHWLSGTGRTVLQILMDESKQNSNVFTNF